MKVKDFFAWGWREVGGVRRNNLNVSNKLTRREEVLY